MGVKNLPDTVNTINMVKRINYGIYGEYLDHVEFNTKRFVNEKLNSPREISRFLRQIKKDFKLDELSLLILKSIIKKNQRHLLEISESFEISKQLTYKKCEKLIKKNLIERQKRGIYVPNFLFCSMGIIRMTPAKIIKREMEIKYSGGFKRI